MILFNGIDDVQPSHAIMSTIRFFLPLCLSVGLLFGCSANVLDGGSDTNGNDSGDDDSSKPAQAEIKQQPLAGEIDGVAFTAVSVDIEYSTRNSQWFFHARNYGKPCRVRSEPPSSEQMLLIIGSLDPRAGTQTIEYADGHGASLQRGVYEAGTDPDYTEPADDGVLVLDSWSETEGDTVTGALRLQNADSLVEGTFEATVCAAR